LKIKVHEREKKAVIRFIHPSEIPWFEKHMAFIRDSDPKTHPPITLKNEQGTIRFAEPKPMPVGAIGKEIPSGKLPTGIPKIIIPLPALHRGKLDQKKELKNDS